MSTLAGRPGIRIFPFLSPLKREIGVQGAKDGKSSEATFSYPTGVVLDKDENLFVSDYFIIRKVTPDGEVKTIAGGSENGLRFLVFFCFCENE